MSEWYERLVQKAYQTLVDQNTDIKNVVVQHNVTLTGRSGASHQIDVYWEFKIADTLYRTCIECRDYASRIKKGRVVEFQGILEDIGSANGMMVTRIGFQEGALIYANHHGVRLLLINPVLRRIEIGMHIVVPVIENLGLEFDSEQIKSVFEAAGIDSLDISFNATAEDVYLYDEAGNQTRSIAEAISQPIGTTGKVVVKIDGEYLKTLHGFIKLQGISFDRHEEVSKETLSVGGSEGEEIAKTAIQDVLENKSKYIFDDGSVGDTSRKNVFPSQG